MEFVFALLIIAGVLFGFDRIMLLLETRGVVRWRRTWRDERPTQDVAQLESLMDGPSEGAGR